MKCKGKTKKGLPCKNPVVIPEDYCRHHLENNDFNSIFSNFAVAFNVTFYTLLVMLLIGIGIFSYINSPEDYVKSGFSESYEIIAIIILLGLIIATFTSLFSILRLVLCILSKRLFKDKKTYLKYKKSYLIKAHDNSKIALWSRFMPGLIILGFLAIYSANRVIGIYDTLREDRILTYIVSFELFFYYLSILIITNLIINTHVEKKILKKTDRCSNLGYNKISNHSFWIMTIFVICLGFSSLGISLNHESSLYGENIDCSGVYVLDYTEKIIIEKGSILVCSFRDKPVPENYSGNYTIKFKSPREPLNTIYFNATENLIKIPIPNSTGTNSFDIYQKKIKRGGLIKYFNFEIVDTLDFYEKIKEKEEANIKIFLTGWIAFFLLIQFYISFTKWLKELGYFN